ncbi:MAG TPA: protein kinase [Solirubrobacteraceae bacterium]|jgi:serine/threonine-protein kinase|nr:protein kinase [Solirubrobacteraceae bacterium]
MPYAPDLAGCALDGRYELHELIGEGTFGRVYRGYDRRLARAIAIKVIKPWWAEDPEGAESFEREAQLLARVSDPGIVQIFDVGQAEEGLYFVTELVEGESLAMRLRRDGALAVWEACDIAEQLCRALQHAHAEHIVHRDIKPANVLLSDRGRVKVGDLGIARLAEGSTDGGTATIVGTPRYMAPEQASGQPVTPATDVYSAGIVLYEMLAGRAPFGGESAVEIALQHVNLEPPPLPHTTPRALSGVIARALEKDPADRYQSAVAMADALERARESSGADRIDTPVPSGEWWEAPTHVRDEATEIFAADTRTLPRGGIDPTRPAPRMTPRRTVNPAARRRSVAVFVLALAVLSAMLVVARALTAAPTATIPKLNGLTAREVTAKLHVRHLKAAFSHHYNSGRPGTAFAETPGEGDTVKQGSTVSVAISKGPAPVSVPSMTKEMATAATADLHHHGLKADVTAVPAPGVTPGVVVRQSPTAGHQLKPGDTVQLFAAEQPSWHVVTSFSGGHSVPFQIRGSQWRVVYSMSYNGTCDFVFFCNGPNAQVIGPSNQSFGMSSGSDKTRVFKTGPGIYQISIGGGWDSASWSVEVEDWL